MKVNIGLAQKDRDFSIKTLNALLADESLLYTKTRNYHWHVTGPSFMEYHKFLDAQYNKLAEIADQIAERIRNYDGRAFGTLIEFKQNSRLKETPKEIPNDKKMLANLLADHEAVIISIRKGLEETDKHNDAGVTDFLTALLQEHETMAWMLRSYLE